MFLCLSLSPHFPLSLPPFPCILLHVDLIKSYWKQTLYMVEKRLPAGRFSHPLSSTNIKTPSLLVPLRKVFD
jgi:hypothetical protein